MIYNDANDHNVLMDHAGEILGLIDLGDSVHSPRIVELAVAGAYAMLGRDDPISAILPLVAGYHEVNPLTGLELELLFDLMQVRLAMSVAMAAQQHAADPENEYLLISQKDIHDLLGKLQHVNGDMVHYRMRDACGLEPVPGSRRIRNWLEENAGQFLRAFARWI